MKIKRYKRIQKTLNFYQRNFKFHPPYNILLDGTFCKAALEGKVNIKEQFPSYLGAETKIITTKCVILETEQLTKLIKDLYGAWLIVKQFPLHQCGHKLDPQPASKCIKTLLGKNNPNRYVVATMDPDLRSFIRRRVAGTPIIYLHRQTPTIERPSINTEKFLASDTDVGRHEYKVLDEMKKKILGEDDKEKTSFKIKRKSNPNPLSCLKSKKEKMKREKNANKATSKRRRRKMNKEADIVACIDKVFSNGKNLKF